VSVDNLLTTKQLMDLLHVDRTTIYRMLNDRRLPGVRVGGQWRFPREAIDKWLEDQTGTKPVESKLAENAPTVTVEVLPVKCLWTIQEVFAQTSDVGAVTTDLAGKPLTALSNSCAFCDLIFSSEQGRARCESSWRKLADQEYHQPRLEKCHAGFTYARGRVVVQDRFIAMFFVGQFVVGSAETTFNSARLAELAQKCGVDAKDLARAASEIRVIEKSRADRLLNLLQLVADSYSTIGEERLGLITRLRKVAEIAGVSPE
jgi:excisionase family DNA binding protein